MKKYARRSDVKEQAVNVECGGGVFALRRRFSRYVLLGVRLSEKANIGRMLVF